MQRTAGFRRRALIASSCLLAGCIVGPGDKPTTDEIKRTPLVHRVIAPTCSAPSSTPSEPDLTNVTSVGCTRNEDCPNGQCLVANGASSCVSSSCVVNADCAGLGVCECAGPGSPTNQCVTPGCIADADCGDGGYCSPTQGSCGTRNLITNESQNGYPHHCHTQSDACLDDTDCADANAYCRYEASSLTWQCTTQPCP